VPAARLVPLPGLPRVVLEVDGACHRARVTADASRDRKLARPGYRVLRLSSCPNSPPLRGVGLPQIRACARMGKTGVVARLMRRVLARGERSGRASARHPFECPPTGDGLGPRAPPPQHVNLRVPEQLVLGFGEG
jgi:hypothetical protein